jgi:parallel beta-helix repeat protein
MCKPFLALMDASAKPAAFLSYDHLDDRYGHISQFKERLSDEVCIQTGEEFSIFQDRSDISWGENWRRRIEDSLDYVVFFIPIITPSFFKSEYCRTELKQFLEREKRLHRRDFVLPVYYVSTPLLDDADRRAEDELAREISKRQYADWRELRFEPFDSPRVGKELERLAAQIRETLDGARSSGCMMEPRPNPARTGTASTVIASTGIASNEKPPARQKIEHRTIVVDQMHRGDHTTINEAVMIACPGDRILVKPGLYEEEMTIDKPLEILGDGDLRDIVIRATGKSALLFKTAMGRVSNLTLQQSDGDGCCVDISQGRLELDGCDIAGHAGACVAIHCGADPRLRKNRIHDSKAEGISVYDGGLGILEENDIYSNAGPGVAISKGGSPILLRNRINENGGEAIRVFDEGQGTIEENDLRDNLQGPWSISNECERNLKRSGNLE